MPDVALVAVVFPGNLPFFNYFLASVKHQTTRSFDLIIINDGAGELTGVIGPGKQHIKEIIDIGGLPFEIRIKAIKEVAKRGYKKLVFSDTDDTLSFNRIEVISEELNHFSIVCNDLDILDERGNVVERSYWKSRLGERFVFDHTFLTDKNIVGFGNCGFRLDINFPQFDVYPNITAPDWFFFYLILLHNNEALFTSQCTVGYRQHSNNIIGLKTVTEKRFLKAINCKIEHYNKLNESGYNFESELSEQLNLKETVLKDKVLVEKVLNEIKERNLNLFWWEETKYLI